MNYKVIGTATGAIAIGAAAALLLWHRNASAREIAPETAPTVAVADVTRRDLSQVLTVQAEFRPYQEVELYSKVAGYLKDITVDFGDRVKAGDRIATIEMPELGDQLNQAIAAEKRAEADYSDAHLDYTRLVSVNQSQPNLVAQQDLDTAESRDHATEAAVAGARADVEKFRTMVSYTRITAPFDGVITARYADPGALIQSADADRTQALPLVRLSENQLLRLDFPVSVSHASQVDVGIPVQIKLEGSDRLITEKISRFTRRVSLDTRTMETEVEVPNPDLKLIPGMYATVILHIDERPGALAVPVQAVNASGEPTVYVVGADSRIEEHRVKLGIETPNSFEVLAGLNEGDRVLIGSRAGIQPGQNVLPKEIELASAP
jgi:RND family efflux transporter MFP subunit